MLRRLENAAEAHRCVSGSGPALSSKNWICFVDDAPAPDTDASKSDAVAGFVSYTSAK